MKKNYYIIMVLFLLSGFNVYANELIGQGIKPDDLYLEYLDRGTWTTVPTTGNDAVQCHYDKTTCYEESKIIEVCMKCEPVSRGWGNSYTSCERKKIEGTDEKICSKQSENDKYKCYRLKKADGEYDYQWTNTPGTNYEEVRGITNKNDCAPVGEFHAGSPNVCDVNTINNSINPSYVCENNISTNKLESGSSCTKNQTTFYEYKCTENFVANYKPGLKNKELMLNIDRSGLSLGFEYNITLTSIKTCEGIFYDGVYNKAYNLAKLSLDSATNAEDKAKFQNMLEEIKSYATNYNNIYKSFNEESSIDNSKINVAGDITIEYLKTNQKANDNLSSITYPFDVQIIDRKVKKVEQTNTCIEHDNIEQTVEVAEDNSLCISNCMNDIVKITSICKNKCDGQSSCLINCIINEKSSICSEDCNKTVTNNHKSTCTNKRNLQVTLADGTKVSPFSINITETYQLSAPKAYLDNNGKIVKRIYSNEIDTGNDDYIDGGHKFYLDNIKDGDNYKITTVIKNLGVNGKSTIKNQDCKLKTIQEKGELYRIIDVNNPFVNNERLNLLNNNWKNDTYDFTNITNKYQGSLYVFNISKSDINAIKNNNKLSDAYLGVVCKDKKNWVGIIGQICEEIYSK